MPVSWDQFIRRIVESGLSSKDDVESLLAALPSDKRPADAEALAKLLVREKKLTAYQTQQIYAGKGKSLTLGNYVILERIGAGGMGQVFKARHKRMNRTVAVKLLPPEVNNDEAVIRRFQREVQAAAKLTHPNIVIAYDADEAPGGVHFLVMEYVEGNDLAQLAGGSKLPVEQVLNYILQAARGLAFAHESGVVHRDIKPANLLLDKKGTVKILDMGLARIHDAAAQAAKDGLTKSGDVMGTVDYMAPEQAFDTHEADERADIYSLGCTLYRLLSGKCLYEAETIVQKLMAHQSKPIPSLLAVRDDVSPELDAIFQRMVAKQPDERYQSMHEVATALEAVIVAVGSGTPSSNVRFGASHHRPAGGSSISSGDAPTSAVAEKLPLATSSPDVAPTINLSRATESTDPVSDRSITALRTSVSRDRRQRLGGTSRRKRFVLIAAGLGVGTVFLLMFTFHFMLAMVEDRREDDVARVTVPESGRAEIQQTPIAPPPIEPTTNASQDYALRFNGESGVDIPTLQLDPAADYTWEAYVSSPQHSPSERMGVVIGVSAKDDSLLTAQQGPEPGHHFSFTRGIPGHWRWKFGVGSEGDSISRVPARADRTHLACVHEGTTYRVFSNGKLSKQIESDAPRSADGFYQLGARFVGVIDEVRISNSARYSADFEPEPRFEPDADTLALYHFDEGSGEVLKDFSGHDHHGKVIGAKWVGSDGEPIADMP